MLQKFSFVLDKIKELPKRNYALIVDEAHSSHTRESATSLRRVLAAGSLEEAEKSIVRDTLRFTRRQATWFKTFADATWVDAAGAAESISLTLK